MTILHAAGDSSTRLELFNTNKCFEEEKAQPQCRGMKGKWCRGIAGPRSKVNKTISISSITVAHWKK